MRPYLLLRLLLAFCCLSAVSCVVGRREMPLPVPAGARPQVQGQASITSVVDQRRFQNKPSDPSSPSMDGDVTQATPAELSRIIGRQRGGYGKAMGDIALAHGKSVPAKVTEIVTEALRRRGYEATGNSSNTLKVDVQKFWGWMSPGAWAITLEAEIECLVIVRRDGRTRQFTVRGYGENVCQAAGDTNWNEAYDWAVEDFMKKLDQELAASAF